MERYYGLLLEKGPSSILDAWKGFPNILGKPVKVSTPEGIYEGTAIGLDEEGALLIRDSTGRERKLLAGDVSLSGGIS